MNERTCALVVVGNEILSGKIRDSNAYFTACQLRQVGVALQRISVIPDELDVIAEEVRECAARFDIVLTSGGVGPTHDDVTMEGVAAAFGRKLIAHPELEGLIRRHMTGRVNAAGLKMAIIPDGAILNSGGDIRFPTVQVENVYILPGIPQLFETKLLALKERFATDPYFMRAIYTSASEGAIAEHLNACLAEFPALLLGSYPRIGDPEYRVKLTLESKDHDYLERAFAHLIGLLPVEAVVRTE
ncbi:MAG TPA: competence/damage-inducible protein A [Candidatus Binataceae bacterium]|nr:competence/damage-inducible protein A [Candidatus Binataceae bacterium]